MTSPAVLLLITELRPAGAERVVLETAARLDRQRFTPLVAALDGRGEYAEKIRDLGVSVFDLGAYRRTDLPVIWRLRKTLRENNIRLVHAHLIHASVVGCLAARPLGIPVVTTAHIVDRRPVWWHFLLDRLTARWRRKTLCVSEAVRRFHQQKTGLPDSHYQVVRNGIDVARFQSHPPKIAARERLGLPQDVFLAGAIGRFDRQKGFDVFLRALAQSPLAHIHAAVAGYGPEENRLKTLATELGLNKRVHWPGFVAVPEVFYGALDVCVVPSRWEGFGLVAAEALAAGVPVVASDVDSLPEIVRDEIEGRLVPPDDPVALAEAIRWVADDSERRGRLSANAAARGREFPVERMVSETEAVYEAYL